MKSELSRITGCFQGDIKTFENIYNKVQPLINYLTYSTQINGFSKDIIKSFYEDKFIFAFNKYHKLQPEILKAYIINSLNYYKIRLLSQNNLNIIYLDDFGKYNGTEEEMENKEIYYSILQTFIEKRLSDEAQYILNLKLNPPKELLELSKNKRISIKILIDYIKSREKIDDEVLFNFLKKINKQIKKVLNEAKEYFYNKDLELLYNSIKDIQ